MGLRARQTAIAPFCQSKRQKKPQRWSAEVNISPMPVGHGLVERVQLQGRPSQVKFAVSIPNSGTFFFIIFFIIIIRSKTLEPSEFTQQNFKPKGYNNRS